MEPKPVRVGYENSENNCCCILNLMENPDGVHCNKSIYWIFCFGLRFLDFKL